MPKYKNKYRIETTRLQGWDYRTPASYFITICTHEKQHFFGECKEGIMRLSTVGLIAQGCWYEIPKFNDHVELGAFIIMPNHIHGILNLVEFPHQKSSKNNESTNVETGQCQNNVETGQCQNNVKTGQSQSNVKTRQCQNNVKTRQCLVSTNNNDDTNNNFYQKISPKSGSISVIIGSFKSATTKHIRKTFPDCDFRWQSRFHEHIIRNNESYQKIANYILNNPQKWDDDCYSK